MEDFISDLAGEAPLGEVEASDLGSSRVFEGLARLAELGRLGRLGFRWPEKLAGLKAGVEKGARPG